MITINLLPKRFKRRADIERINLSIVAMLILLFVIVGLTIELLFATKKFLNANIETLESQQQAYEDFFTSDVNKDINDKIVKTNQLAIQVGKIQAGRTSWSELLTELAIVTPPEIKLTDIQSNILNKSITISGRAETRDRLLDYSKSLESSDYFASVDLPSSYLSSPTDISFEIKANLSLATSSAGD
ncbi:PilN domain-containing protein [Patescibacteria group bacterium]|nr:PilN domain-containing protein [Patescibacteria group bacterium]